MTSTITAPSAATTTPDLVLGYATARMSRNLVHDTLDGSIAVVLRAPRLRTGTLELLYADEAEAWAAITLHAEVGVFVISDTDIPDIDMSYVLSDGGDVALTLDDQTRAVWTVSVPYQEVQP